MMALLRALVAKESDRDFLEYALLVALLSVVSLLALRGIESAVSETFSRLQVPFLIRA